MKVMLVNGSPHQFGCTYTALQEVADSLKAEGIETEIFWIGNKAISGCIGCGVCKTKGQCVFDDVVNEFVAKAKICDGFVFGSSVHYAGASGAMTCFMDRVFYSGGKNFLHKPASVVVSARRAGTTATYEQLIKYMGITQMPIVSSRYWNMVHGSTPEQVKQDEEGMQTMRFLGQNMAYILKCIDVAKQNGITPPDHKENVIFTNFIR